MDGREGGGGRPARRTQVSAEEKRLRLTRLILTDVGSMSAAFGGSPAERRLAFVRTSKSDDPLLLVVRPGRCRGKPVEMLVLACRQRY